MNELQRFTQKRAVYDIQIYTWYQSYKKFMSCDTLPDFKIFYVDSRLDPTITYKASINLYEEPIKLYVNIAYFNIKNEDTKATMVHEFTHLYDIWDLSKKCDKQFLKDNAKMYTEFHAPQIEILYLYHVVNNVSDQINFLNISSKLLIDLPIK